MSQKGTVQTYIDQLVQRLPKLYGILVTDKDGVVLVKSLGPELASKSLEHSFSASFTSAAEQSSKLFLGVSHSIVTFYDNYAIIQANLLPLVLTMFAAPDANTGLLLSALPELRAKLEGIRSGVRMQVQTQSEES